MDDASQMKKFQTQLDKRLIKYMAPNGYLDASKVRSVFMAAGIPTPVDDSDLLLVIESRAVFLNKFLSDTHWQPEGIEGGSFAKTKKGKEDVLKKKSK
jgi:hypothetical protein